ncbi:MAG TPA: MlaD family protein [Vicinamibacteria bacterium]|nr:MlaD family protein [Vicinamibacteria bacterium]
MSETLPKAPPARGGADREFMVGMFVLIGIAAVLTALYTLTDAALFRGRYIVTTRVPNAAGIRRGDPVQMRGVNIGRVQKFGIAQEGVTIHLEIEGEYGIPSDSRVELKSAGPLSGMVANVVPGQAATLARGGQDLPGTTAESVFDQAGKLADESEKVLERVKTLLSERTVTDVQATATDMRALLHDLSEITARQKKDLIALAASLRRSAEGVERATAGPELEDAVKRVRGVAERMETLTDSLDRSAKSTESLLARIERGEGTLGKLSKDETLYLNASEAVANLNQAVVEMRKLTEDIRKQPKRYLKLSLF